MAAKECGPVGTVIQKVIGSDYLSRQTMPDVYPRRSDPFRPAAEKNPGCNFAPGTIPPGWEIIANCLTAPAQRPTVIQRATSTSVTAPLAPSTIPVANSRFECDSMLFDVISTGANSAFVGFGSTVTTGNGIEIVAGTPIILIPDNTRELWELQRVLEYIAAMMAADRGLPCLPMYRAPRVCFDASNWYLTAPAAINVSVTLFHIPQDQ